MNARRLMRGDTRKFRIVLATRRGGVLFLLFAVWLAGALAYGAWTVLNGRLLTLALAICFAVPVLVLLGVLLGLIAPRGRIVIRADGFTRTLPNGKKHFIAWTDVVRFHAGWFGEPSGKRAGAASVQVTYRDRDGNERTELLSGNLHYTGEDLARLMDHARNEAARGWHKPPRDLAELEVAALGIRARSALRRRVTARAIASRRA